MNKINANKSSSNLNQKLNKSLKKPHSNKSKENKNKIQNKNKLRQFNKSDLFNNNTNVHSYNNTNHNLRAKSNKKIIGNKDKNKSNNNINNINSNPFKNNMHNNHKIVNNISSLNQIQKKIKFEINNENINNNIINNTNPSNIKNIHINPIIKSNQKITEFNSNNINGNNRFKSDIKNPNFFVDHKKEKEKGTILAKTELKKFTNNKYQKNLDKIPVPNFENLKYISLEDTEALFTAWQNCSMIYKIFEEKIMKKNDFEINKTTLELITKNSDACKQLNDQKFWILYIEYLINNNLLINEQQFLTVINEAFSYMIYNCTQLRVYYLQKIKKYAPVFLPDGTFDDSDEAYINKLNQATISFIKRQKGVNSSNVKLKSANKGKNCKLENDNEYKEIIKENKIRSLMDNEEIFRMKKIWRKYD